MEQPGSLRELFDAEYPALVRLATLITGDAAVAEDVVQEAFARALARCLRVEYPVRTCYRGPKCYIALQKGSKGYPDVARTERFEVLS